MGLGFRLFHSDDRRQEQQTDAEGPRPGKGESILKAVEDFVAIDIETTGLSSTYDRIIELAAIRYRKGVPVAQFDQLVNPGRPVGGFVTMLTGITDELLAKAPSIRYALPAYLKFIGSDIVVGHNVSFDVNFIYDNCERAGLRPFSNDYVDTMRIARRLHKDWPHHTLDTLIEELGVGSRGLHRALHDTELTARCYLVMTADPSWDEAMAVRVRKYKPGLKAADIVAVEGLANEDSPLYGKVCVFTGTLDNFVRKDAMQIVVNIGGICGDSVTKKTNFLILGNNDYCQSIKDGKSAKQKKAEKLILEGADLQIIPESVFIDMITEQ